MSKKALTFEEVWISSDREPGELKDYALNVFELARLGMIPAEGAIAAPPVEEWPEWAEYAELAYVGKMGAGVGEVRSINKSYRPAPAWTPKVGDGVFWRDTKVIFTIAAIDNSIYVLSKGGWASLGELKPASSLDQLGKPWEEI